MSILLPKFPRHMSGISLLEVLLSLSIIAIILVMATRYFFVASQNDKINTTVSQVGGLVAAAHNWKGAGYNYAGISIDTLVRTGQLSNFPGMDATSKSISTMWGTPIQIESTDNMATITVIFPNDKASPCEALHRAYPSDETANIVSKCEGANFVYSFP